MPDNTDNLPPEPPAIPGFHLIQQCGRGRSGEVWLALDADGIRRAVKFIRRQPDQQPFCDDHAKAVRIYRQLALRHPHLQEILFAGEIPAGRYEVAPLADNRLPAACGYEPATLASRLQQGRLPSTEAETIFRQLLDGVTALHRAGFAHGDLKPENLLFCGGHLVIADPGLLALTDQIALRGTTGYHPARRCPARDADIYALGKIMYQLFSGAQAADFPALPSSNARMDFRHRNRLMLRCCSPDMTEPVTLEELQAAFPAPPSGRVSRSQFLIITLLTLLLLLEVIPVELTDLLLSL